ncbi:MAG: DUF3465 domain-containing protein [Methylococcaceae bacterium]|nr:DUF3465 domain-containing protein [Methylococcaceae bacterium]MDP3904604.1 DUF3465 domain-containing protein [Methylococcaceae bacterium]
MKKLLIIVVVAMLYVGTVNNASYAVGETVAVSQNSEQLLAEAYKTQRSDFQVQGTASVIKLLPDDNNGSRHQRFLVRLSSGQTLLIAHNTSLAARIDDLKEKDSVEFYGEYEWNNKGGVIHWTHRDPKGHHASGWIKHADRTFQ